MALSWIERGGKRILVTRYEPASDDARNIALLKEQGELERADPNILILSDYTGTSASLAYLDAVKAYGKEFRSGRTNVKNAVVGITGLKKMLFSAYIAFTGDRHTRSFATVEEAQRWLAE